MSSNEAPLLPQPSTQSSRRKWFTRTCARLRQAVDTVRVFSDFPFVFACRFGLAAAKKPRLIHLRNGVRYIIRPGQTGMYDLYVVREAWLQGIHDHLLKTLEDSTAVVIDIGAHLGAFAIKAAKTAPSVRVLCFEPDPDNHLLLAENIRLNELQDRVQALPLAVSGSCGSRTLFLSGASRATPSFFRTHFEQYSIPYTGERSVSCTTLEEILDTNRISQCDLVKLDCEGAEYEILYNTPQPCLERIRAIALECHQIPGESLERLQHFLMRSGFCVACPIPNRPDVVHAIRVNSARCPHRSPVEQDLRQMARAE